MSASGNAAWEEAKKDIDNHDAQVGADAAAAAKAAKKGEKK